MRGRVYQLGLQVTADLPVILGGFADVAVAGFDEVLIRVGIRNHADAAGGITENLSRQRTVR